MLRRPQDLLNHQHCELIKEIVTEIVNRGLRTTLHKVKGHASIIGNEKADAIAKAAATGDTSDYEECEKYESPSNNRLTQYWPHKTQWNQRWSRTNGQRTLIDRFKRVNPLTDLHDSVRHYCHQKSRFGMANRATCYFEAFKRIEDRLDLPASNEYMTSGKIKYAERKTALRYRYGTMWTRKMAYRCGHAPSSKCLLCGDEDGGNHTASGCPALKRMYINRHNKVGRLIMTRVLRGRKGAFVIQMDLGSTENCAEDGIMAHQSRNIPWELLPRGLKEAVQQAQGTTDKRPDGMLYKPKNGNNPAEYWIIEVKICRDSDPTGQQSKADYQHQVLIDKIKDIDPTAKVWYYPLLVGVAGTIYNSTTMNLQALGIKGQALKQCISEVHTAAVKSLHSIYIHNKKKTRKAQRASMAQEELQESKLTKAGAGGSPPTDGCNYPMVGWPSVILTPMGPSLNLTREGTSRPSLRSSLSLSHSIYNVMFPVPLNEWDMWIEPRGFGCFDPAALQMQPAPYTFVCLASKQARTIAQPSRNCQQFFSLKMPGVER